MLFKVCSHLTSFSPFNIAPFNDPFFDEHFVNGDGLKNGQIGFYTHSVKKNGPFFINTMLNKNGPLNGAALNGLKNVKRKQAFEVRSYLTSFSPFYLYFTTACFLQNGVTTHSVRFSARHHKHNVKQKTACFKILIKWAKNVKCEQGFRVHEITFSVSMDTSCLHLPVPDTDPGEDEE